VITNEFVVQYRCTAHDHEDDEDWSDASSAGQFSFEADDEGWRAVALDAAKATCAMYDYAERKSDHPFAHRVVHRIASDEQV
jgi:hypothetical protein